MRYYILFILFFFFLAGCQKEDNITDSIGFENLYTIEDNPADSIQHKRYEIYKTYGVPVYFNDTIGKVYIKTDIHGDSIFQYETLDLNWIFDGTNSGSVTYQVKRYQDATQKMQALHFTEIFLQTCQAALHPHALWLVEKCHQLSSSGVQEKEMVSRYRNLLFAASHKIKNKDMTPKVVEYRNEVIKLKVQNYTSELNTFNKITNEKYYGVMWQELYKNEELPYYKSFGYWYPYPLEEEWEQDSSFRKEMKKYGNSTNPNWPEGLWSDAEVDEYILYCRKLVGSYGFVSYEQKRENGGSRNSPKNTESDLETFLEEMMKYPRAEFLERWSSSPLVLKKYEILYSIIKNKLGVEL